MRVKLLEPIEGYEDVAEYRRLSNGDWYVAHDTMKACQWSDTIRSNGRQLALTPKPLPVVEPPKFLGVVSPRHLEYVRPTFVSGLGRGCINMIEPEKGVCIITPKHCFATDYKLIRTANIPTSPELESLFKE